MFKKAKIFVERNVFKSGILLAKHTTQYKVKDTVQMGAVKGIWRTHERRWRRARANQSKVHPHMEKKSDET